jgi:hypothetical protein
LNVLRGSADPLPPLLSTINNWFPPKDKGTTTGIFLAAAKFDAVVEGLSGMAVFREGIAKRDTGRVLCLNQEVGPANREAFRVQFLPEGYQFGGPVEFSEIFLGYGQQPPVPQAGS